jgi:hypothetical protein
MSVDFRGEFVGTQFVVGQCRQQAANRRLGERGWGGSPEPTPQVLVPTEVFEHDEAVRDGGAITSGS